METTVFAAICMILVVDILYVKSVERELTMLLE